MAPTIQPEGRLGRLAVLGIALVVLAALAARADVIDAVIEALTGHAIEVPGAPVAADSAKLSEHNIEWVREQPPQEQAEFLLASAVRHERGATDLIAELIHGWHGKLERTERWGFLTETALYSSDLRVRAAAIEISLVVNNAPAAEVTADWLIAQADENPDNRPWLLWTMGMVGNRGVRVEPIFETLVEYTYDPDPMIRIWAVEGLAHLGTDETIPEFIRVLGTDPDLQVRERAGCSLAKSGMLARTQRVKAVPGLIVLAEDPNLEDAPLRWVYQALREITDVSLPNESDEWRYWYSTEGAALRRTFRAEPWSVRGNS